MCRRTIPHVISPCDQKAGNYDTQHPEVQNPLGVQTLFIEPGSPWENGYIESLNGKHRDELLDRELFDKLLEAKVLIERWRKHYNTVRPHSSLGYQPPAPEAIQSQLITSAAPQRATGAGLPACLELT